MKTGKYPLSFYVRSHSPVNAVLSRERTMTTKVTNMYWSHRQVEQPTPRPSADEAVFIVSRRLRELEVCLWRASILSTGTKGERRKTSSIQRKGLN